MSYEHVCTICGRPYRAKFPHQRRCSATCTAVAEQRRRQARPQSLTIEEWEKRRRYCRWCGREFQLSAAAANNKQYCSPACQKAGYASRVRAFHERNPDKQTEYRQRWMKNAGPGRDTLLVRLYRRYPDLPTACEACGEARVIDLAHKPAYRRNGAHRTLRQYQRHMFWILCPNCHALIDRGVCQPSDLGLSE